MNFLFHYRRQKRIYRDKKYNLEYDILQKECTFKRIMFMHLVFVFGRINLCCANWDETEFRNNKFPLFQAFIWILIIIHQQLYEAVLHQLVLTYSHTHIPHPLINHYQLTSIQPHMLLCDQVSNPNIATHAALQQGN